MVDITIASLAGNIILLIAIFFTHLRPKLADGLQEKDIVDSVQETEQTISAANQAFSEWVNAIKNVIDDPAIDDATTIETIRKSIDTFEKK